MPKEDITYRSCFQQVKCHHSSSQGPQVCSTLCLSLAFVAAARVVVSSYEGSQTAALGLQGWFPVIMLRKSGLTLVGQVCSALRPPSPLLQPASSQNATVSRTRFFADQSDPPALPVDASKASTPSRPHFVSAPSSTALQTPKHINTEHVKICQVLRFARSHLWWQF